MKSLSVILDAGDRRLLNELQRDSARTAAAIGEAVGMSASACYRRMQRLRESKLIVREAAVVDQRRSPWPVTVFVRVAMERLNEPIRAAFEAKVLGHPQIMHCYAATGDADFIMMVYVASMDEYHRFAREILVADENIKSFSSTFAINCLKSKTAIDF